MSDKYKIVFNRPCLVGRELEYIAEAISLGHISGDGQFTRKCNSLLERDLGIKKVLLTTSCTQALEMAAILLDIKQGDEVIVPSFTFVSTVNAFVIRGAKPVLADVRPDTINIDENQIEKLVSPKTKAIVPVHYAGVGCEMDAISEIAKKHNIAVVEDNAHGLYGKYKNRYLGTFGCLSALSFHDTKHYVAGEGGALLINDPAYIERAEIIREKGTDRSKFVRGEIDKYTWVDIGSNFLPSEITAAFLYAQLEQKEKIFQKRKKIWHYYYDNLKELAENKNIRLPTVPDYCEQSYLMFYMLFPTSGEAQRFVNYLKERGILSVFHYLPLHLSAMGSKYGYKKGDLPVAEKVGDTLVRLPFYNDLRESDLAEVVSAIKNFYK